MSRGPYQYRAHGFTTSSELESPELLAFDGTPDVLIRFGAVADELEGPVQHPTSRPGHRQLRLAADALDHVGASLGARHKMDLGQQKYGLTVPGDVPPAPVPIRRMFLLTDRPSAAIRPRSLNGPAKVTAVVRGTYRRRMSVALGRRSAHFAQCAAVGQRIEIVAVDRPRDLAGLPRLVDALEDNLRGRR